MAVVVVVVGGLVVVVVVVVVVGAEIGLTEGVVTVTGPP
jgi:hypothetical protein